MHMGSAQVLPCEYHWSWSVVYHPQWDDIGNIFSVGRIYEAGSYGKKLSSPSNGLTLSVA